MYNHTTHLTVGVLLLATNVQLADIASVDVLTMVGTDFIDTLPSAPALKALATPIKVVFISEDGSSPLAVTGGAKIVVTVRPSHNL